MYGDALPIVGNKFSKILIFLLINFRILSKQGLLFKFAFFYFAFLNPCAARGL